MLNTTSKQSLYVSGIIHNTIVDGPGIRTSIYLSGCNHFCNKCHNPQTWNPKYGTKLEIIDIVNSLKDDPSDYGITISGGDPFYNAKNLLMLLKCLKKFYPSKNILVYSGYYLHELQSKIQKECLSYIDILIDGPFEYQNCDFSLKFRGSSNQRIIYLNK